MNKKTKNPLLDPVSGALGSLLASGNATPKAQTALYGLSALAHVSVDCCNEFLQEARTILGKITLEQLTTQAERRQLKNTRKPGTKTTMWIIRQRQLAKAKQQIIANFVAQRDTYKALSDHIDSINAVAQKRVDALHDIIHEHLWGESTY